MAMTYESSLQQVNRIMGNSAQAFENWANTQAASFNMSRADAMQYGAVYGNLMSSITSDQAQAMQYTTDLLKSSAVVASATGRTMDDVMERIRSGLLGNTEAIEDLGINVNVAMLESTQAFQRFANGKSWDQLDFQTQQQIRLFAIFEQSSSKFGTSVYNNTASGLMQFTALLKDAQLNLGQAFLPIVNSVIPILVSFANNLKYVTGVFSQFMQALFGTNTEQAKNVQVATKAATAQNNLAKATKAASAAAKRGVAGFDEINQLQEATANSADSASGALSSGASAGSTTGAEGSETKISQGILDFANKAKSALAPVGEYFREIGGYFKQFWTNIQPALQPIIAFLKQMFIPIWETIKFVIVAVFEFIKDVIKGSIDIIQGIIKVFGGIIKGDWSMIWDGIKDILKGAWEAIYGGMKLIATFMRQIVLELAYAIKTTWDALWGGVKTTASGVWGWLSTKASEIFNGIKAGISNAMIAAGNVVTNVWEGIKNTIKGGINWVIDKINYLIDTINSIKISIPPLKVAGKTLFEGASLGFPQINKIPLLANGGIVNSPTLAMIGESGKEAVVPLENTSFVDTLASAIGTAVLNAMQFSQGSNTPQQVQAVFNLEGSQFARAIAPLLDKENARRGNMAIQGV
ncbi:hypothetical protein LPY66_18155 [Dehalobacter sp. DCM]|uniref:phage tail protein n=1 Tax=Dehalobacter sp. DCM TaxID=2907827 RepID=UPI003081767F|nr:hypothetical protein LPY66_18155 [Dehalobacter sp. DCM]